MYTEAFKLLFWSKVRKGQGCWEWVAGKTKSGYGQLQARKIQKQPMLAHRVSWQIEHGPIAGGLHVLHRCDNPACVRPSHLFLGTQVDNNDDRDKKGRVASGDRNGSRTKRSRNPFVVNGGSGLRGASHPMARLSDDEVAKLRSDYASGLHKKAELARRYKISATHVGRLVGEKSRRSDVEDPV